MILFKYKIVFASFDKLMLVLCTSVCVTVPWRRTMSRGPLEGEHVFDIYCYYWKANMAALGTIRRPKT